MSQQNQPIFSAKPGTFFVYLCKNRAFDKKVKRFYFFEGQFIKSKSEERQEKLNRVRQFSKIGRSVSAFNNTFNLVQTVVEMKFAE